MYRPEDNRYNTLRDEHRSWRSRILFIKNNRVANLTAEIVLVIFILPKIEEIIT